MMTTHTVYVPAVARTYKVETRKAETVISRKFDGVRGWHIEATRPGHREDWEQVLQEHLAGK